jgi:hypothetical protein
MQPDDFDKLCDAERQRQREQHDDDDGKTLSKAVELFFFESEDAAREYLRAVGDQQNYPMTVVRGEYHRDSARIEKFVEERLENAKRCVIELRAKGLPPGRCRFAIEYPLRLCLAAYGYCEQLLEAGRVGAVCKFAKGGIIAEPRDPRFKPRRDELRAKRQTRSALRRNR